LDARIAFLRVKATNSTEPTMSNFDGVTKSRSTKARSARAAQRRHSQTKGAKTAETAPPASTDARGPAKTVLIVEDNELNMKLFNDLLEAHGYRTVQTRNGMDALPLARKHQPNLILMDIQLPEVSGLDVTKWLKEDDALKDIPVIAVTAFAMKGDEQRIREGGCEAYISKPIAVGAFLKIIDQFANKA
jgi:two-component system, cell cycle response regulator DivK